jgi:hypothetical protein
MAKEGERNMIGAKEAFKIAQKAEKTLSDPANVDADELYRRIRLAVGRGNYSCSIPIEEIVGSDVKREAIEAFMEQTDYYWGLLRLHERDDGQLTGILDVNWYLPEEES